MSVSAWSVSVLCAAEACGSVVHFILSPSYMLDEHFLIFTEFKALFTLCLL